MNGLNQSYREIYVVPSTSTLPTTGSTGDLTAGRFGIFNGDTYAATAAPAFASVKSILFAQGASNQLDIAPLGGIRNESDKTRIIHGTEIVGWSVKYAQAGQTMQVAIGYNADENEGTISGKCDQVKHLYIRLSGKPISNINPQGVVVHITAQGPCCADCGDNCEDVEGCFFRDAFYDQLIQHKLPGGIPITKFISVTKTDDSGEEEPQGLCGLLLEGAFVSHTSDNCYFDLFPFDADPVHIEVSEFNPDWHEYECPAATIPITVVQEVEYPIGHGEFVQRLEARSKMDRYREFSKDLGVRKAKGDELFADTSEMYDEYTIVYKQRYHVLGWSDERVDTHRLQIYFENGEANGTAFRTAMNTYITAANPNIPAVPSP